MFHRNLFKQADFSLLDLVNDNHIKMTIKSNLTIIQALNQLIDDLKEAVLQHIKLKPEFLSPLTHGQTYSVFQGLIPFRDLSSRVKWLRKVFQVNSEYTK